MPHTLLYLGMRFLSRLHSALHSAWSHTPHTDLRPAHHTRTRTRATPESSPHSSVFPCVDRTSLHLHQAPSSHAPLVSPRTNLPLLFNLSRRFSLYLPPPRSASPTPLTLIYVPAFRISYPSHSHPRSRVTPTPRRPHHTLPTVSPNHSFLVRRPFHIPFPPHPPLTTPNRSP